MNEVTVGITEDQNAPFRISTGPVSPSQALEFAAELEKALGEIENGERKPNKIPMEPMARLIQFTRDSAASDPHPSKTRTKPLTGAEVRRFYTNIENREGLTFAAFSRLVRYFESVYNVGVTSTEDKVPEPEPEPATLYAVLTSDGGEGVLFSSMPDAQYTHTGRMSSHQRMAGVPSIGEAFREYYGDEPFQLVKVKIVE